MLRNHQNKHRLLEAIRRTALGVTTLRIMILCQGCEVDAGGRSGDVSWEYNRGDETGVDGTLEVSATNRPSNERSPSL